MDLSAPSPATAQSPGDPVDVTVVVPAYNAARFVERAVISALACGHQDAGSAISGRPTVEVVAVEDCSTDATRQVLTSLEARLSGLRVLRNTRNLGPGGSRNAGIAAARGRWIALLDADDAFLPDRLSRLVGLAEARGADVVADLPVLYDLEADVPAPRQFPASGEVDLLSLSVLVQPHPATGMDLGLMKPVFRRHLAEAGLWCYPDTLRHGEDFALYFDLIARDIGFLFVQEAHYLFSTRIGAVSGSYSPGSVTDVDYRSIAAHARALAALSSDPEIIRLLDERAIRALRQNRIHGWTALRKRDRRRLLSWLRRDRHNITDLAGMAVAKLFGHRGLPD